MSLRSCDMRRRAGGQVRVSHRNYSPATAHGPGGVRRLVDPRRRESLEAPAAVRCGDALGKEPGRFRGQAVLLAPMASS